jgi:glutamyl-tRNA synthetase
MSMRVRFAPSPTGFLHVGSARSALFNWLAARHAGGIFILRSDDTDTERNSPEYQQDIIDGLRWLGLDWDEGVEVGGPYAPYRQSERLGRYREAAEAMLAAGDAYRCFCTAEELDERRKAAMAEGRPPGYDGRCRSIPPDEALRRAESGEPASVRFAVPRPGTTSFDDVVRGRVEFDHDNVDDFVILRTNGSPTYHLASSVDDVDFAISDVVRGEDLLSSTPKHILLGRALGGPEIIYAHLSLLHGPDGKKLSKRHGHTSLQAYRDAGILPEAMVNYLALLGWSPGEDETIVSRQEMVDRFDLGAVSKNPAIFDPDKLEWMNGVYIRDLEPEDFARRARPGVELAVGRDLTADEWSTFVDLAPAIQERAKNLAEVAPQVMFLLSDDVEYDSDSWAKVMETPEARNALERASARLEGLAEWRTVAIEESLRSMLDEAGLSARKGLQPIRVAVTGSSVSPPLFESLEALGRERSLHRLAAALARL